MMRLHSITNKKLTVIIIGLILILLFSYYFYEINSLDVDELSEIFYVDAVYLDDEKHIEIIFEDRSKKSSRIVLEILGMSDSFQKEYIKSSFIEKIPFQSVPTYGWKSMPVTFLVEHKDFGLITIKTEIHSNEESVPEVIFGRT